ncbi:response regulator [Mixta tenebrionis]|uniref:Response regulator transcription factor n=1 Tax=Mixta tenebrionis TaxID=2562439 RepID=A0A506V6T5_9GAMM|nr:MULTISPECIES: response regulator transcription factor [Mixta]QHM74083.1 Transcriptional regulatory protein RcsB [Mixta theicola]TPW41060.1 response regulator transcription factor [Mixta tenebrionis]
MTKTIAHPLRVALLDDHPMIRTAFEICIGAEPDMVLVSTFGSSQVLFSELPDLQLDVLVLDFLLGERELDGLALIKQLRNHFPRLNILISSAMESPAVVKMVLNAGVKGFIGKSQDMNEMIQAIRQVGQGRNWLSRDMAYEIEDLYVINEEARSGQGGTAQKGTLYERVKLLSPREVEVIRCFLNGMSVSQIAIKFKRSRKTVSGQKQSALRKLGLRSDSELFKYSNDLLSRPEATERL